MRILIMAAAAAALTVGPAWAQTDARQSVIERFAADYATDGYNDRAVTFGVEVEGAWWTVDLQPGGAGSVRPGQPSAPTFYFTLDNETLQRLDQRSMNALTAMARAWQDDPTPMDIETMEGFQPDGAFMGWAIPFIFHFWTRGTPEVIPFASDTTRFTHGAQASILYYQPGLRSGFIEIRPGQHANREERDQANPFPSIFIFTEGRVRARIGGESLVLNGGEAIFVPANVPHEFWNDFDQPAQGFMIAFGEGA